MKKGVSFIGLLAYLGLRILAPHTIDDLFVDAGLVFDLFFVAFAIALYRDRFYVRPLARQVFSISLVAFLGGCGVAVLAKSIGLALPFDLTDTRTILLMLLGGPILEELVFRFSLWELIPEVKGFGVLWRDRLSLILTTLFFGAAHFAAYQYVPENLQSFVLFQTAYTLGLGFACGWFRISTRAIGTSIAIHVLFNLGFFAIARGLSI